MADLSVTDVLSQARDILQDKTTPYRYDDTALLQGLNNGLLELRRVRPDAYIATFRDADEVPTLTTTDNLPVDQIFKPGLVFYVAGHASLRDDSYSEQGRAAALMRRGIGTWQTTLA